MFFLFVLELNITVPSFSNTSYITYPTLDNSSTISITFNPAHQNGLLLFNSYSSNDFRDYVSLAIVNSFIVYRYNLGTGNAEIVSTSPVTLNTWHTVTITRLNQYGTLTVDGEDLVNGTSPGVFTSLNLGDVMWLGGYRHFVNISSLTGIENGFVGCISSLRVNEELVDLIMDAESGLGVGECNSSSCDVNPCMNGGTCVSSGNSFICDCPSTHSGPLCANDVDHCGSNPCINGGTCVEHSNGTGFACQCMFGYGGEICNQGQYLHINS